MGSLEKALHDAYGLVFEQQKKPAAKGGIGSER
jgi:hypothetical protein